MYVKVDIFNTINFVVVWINATFAAFDRRSGESCFTRRTFHAGPNLSNADLRLPTLAIFF